MIPFPVQGGPCGPFGVSSRIVTNLQRQHTLPMARPLRIEFPGAVYRVTSRGNRREVIYEDEEDWESFIGVLAEVVDRFNWICHGYCLMSNHDHLVVKMVEGNLSKGCGI